MNWELVGSTVFLTLLCEARKPLQRLMKNENVSHTRIQIFSRLISAAEALAAGGGVSASDPAMSELEERLNNLKRN
jgi:hypothetical protein